MSWLFNRPATAGGAGWTDTNNYIAVWDFGTNSVAMLDNSGHGLNATHKPTFATGPVMILGTNQNGQLNDSWTLDGTEDYFAGPVLTSLNGITNFTVGGWVNSVVDIDYRRWFSTYQASPESGLVVGEPDAGTSFGNVMMYLDGQVFRAMGHVTNQWEFWVFVYNGSLSGTAKMEAYRNGTNVAHGAWSASLGTTTKVSNVAVTLGAQSPGSRMYSGKLDFLFCTQASWPQTTIANVYSNTCPTNNLRNRTP
jgi:hypothetical protein